MYGLVETAVSLGGPRVPLAEIVERHLPSGRIRAQAVTDPRRAEVAQRPEADPVPRDGPELPPHRLDERAPVRVVCSGYVQPDGIDGGEPAHGAGKVHPVEQVLPAV